MRGWYSFTLQECYTFIFHLTPFLKCPKLPEIPFLFGQNCPKTLFKVSLFVPASFLRCRKVSNITFLVIFNPIEKILFYMVLFALNLF